MPAKARQEAFVRMSGAADLPRDFVLRCFAVQPPIDMCYKLLSWNFRALATVVDAAAAAAFFNYISFTDRGDDGSRLVLLVSFAKTVDEEELSEVSKEGGTGVQDAALAVGEGPEKKKKKVLANNLYNRLKVIYPQYTNLPADRMLSPMYVYEITDSLRSASQISSFPNLFKLETYREVRTANDGRVGEASSGGLVTFESTRYATSDVRDSYPVAEENVKILLIGLLASVSFHIDAQCRGGTSGYVPGYQSRLFGTIRGTSALEARLSPMVVAYPLAVFIRKWQDAIEEILDRCLRLDEHFDDICEAILAEEAYFAPRRFLKRKTGKDSEVPGTLVARRTFPFACGDYLSGRNCRNDGPPPKGRCRYLHRFDAPLSPNYVDPGAQAGGMPPLGFVPPPPSGPPPMGQPPPGGGGGASAAGAPAAAGMQMVPYNAPFGGAQATPWGYNMYTFRGGGYGGRGRRSGRGRGRF